MNHQIDQLKEEITSKEAALVKEHLEHQRVEKEKDALKVCHYILRWLIKLKFVRPFPFLKVYSQHVIVCKMAILFENLKMAFMYHVDYLY